MWQLPEREPSIIFGPPSTSRIPKPIRHLRQRGHRCVFVRLGLTDVICHNLAPPAGLPIRIHGTTQAVLGDDEYEYVDKPLILPGCGRVTTLASRYSAKRRRALDQIGFQELRCIVALSLLVDNAPRPSPAHPMWRHPEFAELTAWPAKRSSVTVNTGANMVQLPIVHMIPGKYTNVLEVTARVEPFDFLGRLDPDVLKRLKFRRDWRQPLRRQAV